MDVAGERAIMHQARMVRLPVHVVRELNQVVRARRALEADAHSRGGTPAQVRTDDIAAALGRDLAQVDALLKLAEQPTSLDAPLDAESVESLMDSVVDEHAVDPMGLLLSHEVERLLEQGLAELPQREREVLEGRYGLGDREPQTLEALAERLSLTRERVRQIQQEALVKLKRRMARQGVDRDSVF